MFGVFFFVSLKSSIMITKTNLKIVREMKKCFNEN